MRALSQVLVQVLADSGDQVALGVFEPRLNPCLDLAARLLVTQALKMFIVVNQQCHFDVGGAGLARGFLKSGIWVLVMDCDQLRKHDVAPLAQVASRERPPVSSGRVQSSGKVVPPTADQAHKDIEVECERSRVLVDIPASQRRLADARRPVEMNQAWHWTTIAWWTRQAAPPCGEQGWRRSRTRSSQAWAAPRRATLSAPSCRWPTGLWDRLHQTTEEHGPCRRWSPTVRYSESEVQLVGSFSFVRRQLSTTDRRVPGTHRRLKIMSAVGEAAHTYVPEGALDLVGERDPADQEGAFDSTHVGARKRGMRGLPRRIGHVPRRPEPPHTGDRRATGDRRTFNAQLHSGSES